MLIHSGRFKKWELSFGCKFVCCSWKLWKTLEFNILFGIFPGIKPFQCDRCGKKFTRAYSLKMHRLKHEGKRCFRCQICSATFTSFGEYKHHMRVSRHIIRKPRIYECKTCGAMFTNSGNLIVHLRSLNHEASELANYFQSRWGVQGHWTLSFTQISPGSKNYFSLDSNAWGSFNKFVYDFSCVYFFNECNWYEFFDQMYLTYCIWLLFQGERVAQHFGKYSVLPWSLVRSKMPLKWLKLGQQKP